MTLETFFKKFDQLVDTPDAVSKMRRLVRQLAVQGRLVQQDPGDEPAEQLFAKISADKVSFLQQRRAGRQRTLAGIRADECAFHLPQGWMWTRLGNLCRVQPGFAFRSQSFVHDGSGVPIIRIRDIAGDRTQAHYVGEYREEFLVETGDYLVGMDGNFTVSRWRGPRALLNQRVSRLLWYSSLLEPPFFAIAAQHGLAELQGIKAYTTVDHLSSGQIEDVIVPLPPLAEQKRIVAKVDELMALCDRLEAQQKEREKRHAALARASLARFADAPTPANLTFLFHKSYSIAPADLRQSILTLAVQGKLVPREVDAPLTRLETVLAEASVNGVSKGPTADEGATEILRISAGTSRNDFYVDEDDFKHVDLPPTEIEKFRLAPGDLLACRFNGNLHYVGRFSLYRGLSGRTQVNPDKLIRFRIDVARCEPRYVCYAMNAAPTRRSIEAMCATTAGNIGLSAGRLKTIAIPMPSLAEQRRIVAKVDQLMALVDELEAQLAASRSTATRLLDAIVGELTADVRQAATINRGMDSRSDQRIGTTP